MDQRAQKEPFTVAGEFLKTAPVDVEGMADALGLSVDMNAALSPDVSGEIVPEEDAPAGYHIKINGAHSKQRKLFTLAHEIAHFLIHRPIIGAGIADSRSYRSHLDPGFEVQAGSLATQIVMPNERVRSIYDAGVRDIRALSGLFNVPEEAMRIRLRQMSLPAG